MKYTEIFKIIKETFKEGKDLKLEKKNGRIILSMSKDKNVWTKQQQEYLNNMEDRIVSKVSTNFDEKFDKLFKLINEHINDGK